MTEVDSRPPERNAVPTGSGSGAQGPFGRAIRLGRWAGVPVAAHWSTLATLALFAYVLADSALPAAEPHRSVAAYWITGSITAVVFLLTLLAHELAHALVARRFGMRVRGITLWMLGGLTTLDGDPPNPRADACVAGVGPLTSLLVGGISALAAWSVGGAGLVGAVLVWLAGINIVLAVFNLLPGTPLDGGRLLRAALWRRYRDRRRAEEGAARAGQALGIALMVLGFLEVLAGSVAGVWLALIGWIVLSGAAAERATAGLEELRGLRAEQVMSPVEHPLPDWWTVSQLLGDLTADRAGPPVLVLVDFSGAASGLITLGDLQRVPSERRPEVRLRELTGVRRDRLLLMKRDASIDRLAQQLPAHGGIALVVDEAQRPVGVIAAGELSRALQLAALGLRSDPTSHDLTNPDPTSHDLTKPDPTSSGPTSPGPTSHDSAG
jgi:Zn-dependent protease